jgi:hypothetical protein
MRSLSERLRDERDDETALEAVADMAGDWFVWTTICSAIGLVVNAVLGAGYDD